MKKTEFSEPESEQQTSKKRSAQSPFSLNDQVMTFIIVGAAVIVAVGFIGYYAYHSSKPGIPASRNLGSVTALPLSTESSSTSLGSPTSLNSNNFNLQNNLPTGKSTPKTNSLQSAGSSLSTGQSINTNLPF